MNPTDWQPKYRVQFAQPGPDGLITVSPVPGYSACALLERGTTKRNGVTVPCADLRLYVGVNDEDKAPVSATYKPRGPQSYWIVDIVDPNVFDLDQLLVAILNGDPGLPDGPVVWGKGH